MWNTGAPAMDAMSARSFTAQSRPCLRAAGMDYFQQFEFLGCLDALVPQLDDVHAAGERRVHEVREVAAVLAGVGAEVQAGGGVGRVRGHGNHLSSSKLGRYRGSPLLLS